MPVILNEVKYAKNLIDSGEVGNKPTSTLFYIARYFRQIDCLSKDSVEAKLNEYMQENYKNYNAAKWESVIEDISNKSHKYPLKEINSVPITDIEMNTIQGERNKKYQRLLFVLLCYAKYNNLVSDTNNNWTNIDIPELYRLARVTVKYRNDKFLFLNDLESNGYISFSNRNDNLNLQCNYVSSDSNIVMEVSDFRELGYEYMNYIGDGTFIRCSVCDKIIKKTNNRIMYCRDCAENINRDKTRNNILLLRKENV